MVKKLKPELYHRTVMLFSKTSDQTSKVIEELKELKEALASKNREHILEELADVENVIPYIILMYCPKERIEVSYTGRYDYNVICDIICMLLSMMHDLRYNPHVYRSLTGMLRLLAESLYCIYIDYELQPSDVDEIIDAKRMRTLGKKFKEMI